MSLSIHLYPYQMTVAQMVDLCEHLQPDDVLKFEQNWIPVHRIGTANDSFAAHIRSRTTEHGIYKGYTELYRPTPRGPNETT